MKTANLQYYYHWYRVETLRDKGNKLIAKGEPLSSNVFWEFLIVLRNAEGKPSHWKAHCWPAPLFKYFFTRPPRCDLLFSTLVLGSVFLFLCSS